MFLIIIVAGCITGIYTESTIGRIETYDYNNANYGAYSHGKSDPTESTVSSSSLLVNEGGFSPSDARYALSGSSSNHENVGTGYLSSPYPTPTYSTKYSSPTVQYTTTYENYKSPYSTSSAASGLYSSPKSYSPASYSSATSNHVDSLGYASASPASLTGFTGSSGSLGDYASHGAASLGLRGYATTSGLQSVSRGSNVGDYTTALSGSQANGYLASGGGSALSGTAHSSLGGHTGSTHIGSNYAGYANAGNALGTHVEPGHSYAATNTHGLPGYAISHDYSVNEGDVNYGSTNEAQRYAAPSHAAELAYKDPGYPIASASVYGNLKGSYTTGNVGGHIGGYSPQGSPIYVRAAESSIHGNSAHYPRYEINPGYGFSSKAPLSHLSGIYGASPTKIIYIKDNSFASSSYPIGSGSYKNKIYGLHSHGSPAYVATPTSNSLSGYLSRGYGASSGHNGPYLNYP